MLSTMAEEATSKQPLETGGVLVGYWANAGEVVVTSASGPGSEAEHFHHRFRPDHDHQTAWISERYRESRGVETYLGDWHTHPGTQTAAPSRADRATARRIAAFADARAPRPLTLIMAGGEFAWRPACWVAALVPFFGFCHRVQLTMCTVRTYSDR